MGARCAGPQPPQALFILGGDEAIQHDPFFSFVIQPISFAEAPFELSIADMM